MSSTLDINELLEGQKPFALRSRSFWSSRSLFQKKIIVSAAILSLVLAVGVLFGILLGYKNDPNVCWSEACTSTAKVFKENMDASVDPCEDFYTYACGNFEKQNSLLDEDYLSAMTKLQNEVRDFMIPRILQQSTKKEPTPVKLLRKFFSKATNQDELDKNNFTFIHKLDEEMRQSETLVDLMIATLKRGFSPITSQFFDYGRWFISGKEHPLKEWEKREDESTIKKYRDAYYELITASLLLFKLKSNKFDASRTASNIIDLEMRLSNAVDWHGYKSFGSRTLNTVSDPEIKAFVKFFDYFSKKYEENEDVDVSIDSEFYQSLLTASKAHNLDTFKDLVTWNLIKEFAWPVSITFNYEDFKFKKALYGLKKQPEVKDIVFDHLLTAAPQILGRMYIDAAKFDSSEVDVVKKIMANLKDTLKPLLKNAKVYLYGFDHFNLEMGYPDWIKNNSLFTQSLSVDINEDDDASQMLFKWKKIELDEAMRFEKTHEWPGVPSPASVLTYEDLLKEFGTAFWTYAKKLRYLPAAHFRGLFHDSDRPAYINYAISGTLLVKNLMFRLPYFNPKKSWTAESIYNRSILIHNQYQKIIDDRVNLHLGHGNSTIYDATDNFAIPIAFNAYFQHKIKEKNLPGFEDWSSEKMFFLAYANSLCEVSTIEYLRHRILYSPISPAKYRVNVPLSNFDKFAEAYKCKTGAKMNPETRMEVWSGF